MRKRVEFKSVTVPMLPIMFPSLYVSVLPLIANELVAVQPMPFPTCHLFDLDAQYRRMAEGLVTAINEQVLKDMLEYTRKWMSERVDRSRFPHSCPRCGEPAYVGLNSVDCSKGCD